MEYRAKVVYERDVISEAARRFVFRSIRWDGFAVFFALVAGLWATSSPPGIDHGSSALSAR